MNAFQFLSEVENRDLELANYISNTFIDMMIQTNPNRKDMSRADWLSFAYNEYNVVVTEDSFEFVPKY